MQLWPQCLSKPWTSEEVLSEGKGEFQVLWSLSLNRPQAWVTGKHDGAESVRRFTWKMLGHRWGPTGGGGCWFLPQTSLSINMSPFVQLSIFFLYFLSVFHEIPFLCHTKWFALNKKWLEQEARAQSRERYEVRHLVSDTVRAVGTERETLKRLETQDALGVLGWQCPTSILCKTFPVCPNFNRLCGLLR